MNWKAHGHVFRTKSDTEVIIHGYKQWGDEVLNRLNGMFGLAIWDARKKRLVLARDAVWHQAALLPHRRGALVFRLGDSAGSGHDARQRRDRSHFVESVPALPLHTLALHDIQGRPKTCSRNQADHSKMAPLK